MGDNLRADSGGSSQAPKSVYSIKLLQVPITTRGRLTGNDLDSFAEVIRFDGCGNEPS